MLVLLFVFFSPLSVNFLCFSTPVPLPDFFCGLSFFHFRLLPLPSPPLLSSPLLARAFACLFFVPNFFFVGRRLFLGVLLPRLRRRKVTRTFFAHPTPPPPPPPCSSRIDVPDPLYSSTESVFGVPRPQSNIQLHGPLPLLLLLLLPAFRLSGYDAASRTTGDGGGWVAAEKTGNVREILDFFFFGEGVLSVREKRKSCLGKIPKKFFSVNTPPSLSMLPCL